jgi:hypothetical protein
MSRRRRSATAFGSDSSDGEGEGDEDGDEGGRKRPPHKRAKNGVGGKPGNGGNKSSPMTSASATVPATATATPGSAKNQRSSIKGQVKDGLRENKPTGHKSSEDGPKPSRDMFTSWEEADRACTVGTDDTHRQDDPVGTFDSAFNWVLTKATRESLMQLVGALSLPYTPFKTTASLKTMRNWWGSRREVMALRQQTFIDAVRATFTRENKDRDRASAAIRSKNERIHASLTEFVAQFNNDCQVLESTTPHLTGVSDPTCAETPFEVALKRPGSSVVVEAVNVESNAAEEFSSSAIKAMIARSNSFVFALIDPVDYYWRMHDCWGGDWAAGFSRSPTSVLDRHVKATNQEVARLCSAVIVQVAPTGQLPKERDVPSRRLFWNPHADVSATLMQDSTFRYLRYPDHKPQSINDRNFTGMLKNVGTLTFPQTFVMRFKGPTWNAVSTNHFDWTGWISATNEQYISDKNQPPQFQATINGVVKPDVPYVGYVRLMVQETRRYRQLISIFPQFRFVTTVPEIWEIIAQYQLLTDRADHTIHRAPQHACPKNQS